MVPVVGRDVPDVVLLVLEVLVGLLVLRVLVVRGELAVLGGFALVFVAVALGLSVVVLRVRKRVRIAWPRQKGTQGDPADPRPADAPSCRDGGADADRPALCHERPPRDAALPPRWERDKIEGTDVTVAGTPRMRRSPHEEEGRPPPKRHKPAQAATKRQEPLLVHGVRTCPR